MNLEKDLGDWYPLLRHVFKDPIIERLGRRLQVAINVQPLQRDWFRAFLLCPPDKLKVVIIGQDPYINGEADGLAFSSFGKMTPSLEVVFEEINSTHMCKRTVTHLDDWAEQGVLLLNSVLTTRMGKSREHAGWGWEYFTQEVLQVLRAMDKPFVFMAWGKDAQSILDKFRPRSKYHHHAWSILRACHPQAQNYNPANKFVGCNHFIEANLHLLKYDQWPIWWSDPGLLDDPIRYKHYCNNLLKEIPDVKARFIEKLHSNLTIQNRSHPFDTGLGSDYTEDLPF